MHAKLRKLDKNKILGRLSPFGGSSWMYENISTTQEYLNPNFQVLYYFLTKKKEAKTFKSDSYIYINPVPQI